MLEKVKIALRISHNALDEDIAASITAARLELVRAGVTEAKANDESDELVTLAIKTFCLSIYAPATVDREKYAESFKYQLDNLRKSSAYGGAHE